MEKKAKGERKGISTKTLFEIDHSWVMLIFAIKNE